MGNERKHSRDAKHILQVLRQALSRRGTADLLPFDLSIHPRNNILLNLGIRWEHITIGSE
jgi:hypothetical protein